MVPGARFRHFRLLGDALMILAILLGFTSLWMLQPPCERALSKLSPEDRHIAVTTLSYISSQMKPNAGNTVDTRRGDGNTGKRALDMWNPLLLENVVALGAEGCLQVIGLVPSQEGTWLMDATVADSYPSFL
eukprot:GEMP01080119.1.p1 GENE.GEMP01080119.1~~GEMP01080119.1.p1  ORF type:complete len:132 (+),score=30.57 GEMP01080119.1:36-431(+)